MAHCKAEPTKHPAMDFLYMGIFNTKLYTSKSRANGQNASSSSSSSTDTWSRNAPHTPPTQLPSHHDKISFFSRPSLDSHVKPNASSSASSHQNVAYGASKREEKSLDGGKIAGSIPSNPIKESEKGNDIARINSIHDFNRELDDNINIHHDNEATAKIDSDRSNIEINDNLEKKRRHRMSPTNAIDTNNKKSVTDLSSKETNDASYKKKNISEEITVMIDRESSTSLETKTMLRRSVSSHDHERRSEYSRAFAEKHETVLKESPNSAEANNRSLSSFGNILMSKASPNSISQRSMVTNIVSATNNKSEMLAHTVPSSGSSSARSSGEMSLPDRKSGEANNTQNLKCSSSIANPCNTGKGNANSSSNLLLNNGSLMVGSGNGNVISYGGGVKCSVKPQGEIPNNSVPLVDRALLKRAQVSSDPEEIKNAANEYYRRGLFSEALVLYDVIVSRFPGNSAFRNNRAAALSSLGRLAEAVQECEEAIKLDSGYALAHQRVASLYLRLGLIDRARQHLHMAGGGSQFNSVDLHCLENIEKHLKRCIEARKVGDWYKVIKESDAAVVAGADSAPQIFGYKSEALLRIHKPEDADTVCMAAQRIEGPLVKFGVISADPFLLIVRAQVDITLGRFEKAVGAAESAARIDPSNVNAAAVFNKAQAVASTRMAGNEMFRSGRYFEALALYSEGLESDPTNAILLCNRAICRSKIGQWEKAVEDCDSALRIQPNYTKALMRRASCWTKLERWEEALQDYEGLRRLMPDDLEVSRGLFDVQVAIRKSRGEEVHRMKFGGNVEEVLGDEQFHDAVRSPGLSVVEFITRWSERCQQLSPFLDDLCKRHPCVNFVKVDVEENPNLARMECVSFIPTFKIYMNGQKVKEILGPTEQILEYAVKQFSM